MTITFYYILVGLYILCGMMSFGILRAMQSREVIEIDEQSKEIVYVLGAVLWPTYMMYGLSRLFSEYVIGRLIIDAAKQRAKSKLEAAKAKEEQAKLLKEAEKAEFDIEPIEGNYRTPPKCPTCGSLWCGE